LTALTTNKPLPNRDPSSDPDRPANRDPRGLIYVAGPLTFAAQGELANAEERAQHVQRAARIAERLRKAGWTPFLPHSHYTAWSAALGGLIFEGRSGHDEVMTQCLRWVAVCDALVRIPGYSPGSDEEARHATRLGIPVYPASEIDKLTRART